MEILVFRTNVRYKKHVNEIANRLDQFESISRWNFDLDDKDKILRIESEAVSPTAIENTLKQVGYFCEELPD